MIGELSTLITLGDEFQYLTDNFKTDYPQMKLELCNSRTAIKTTIQMYNNENNLQNYELEIKGWIGTYLSTRGRKVEITDFPDNFISLFANKES